MHSFMNTKKKLSLSEITRQVLNQSIDLLHKLSNKKISKEAAKKEFSLLLSNHCLSGDRALDETKKVRLEVSLNQANEIVDRVESGKIPLYEAIMLVNRVIVSLGVIEEGRGEGKKIESIQRVVEERAAEKEEKVEEFLSHSFDPTGNQAEENMRRAPKEEEKRVEAVASPLPAPLPAKSETSVEALMGQVVFHKKQLEEAVASLNEVLSKIGYTLTSIS